jgi:hypothetical protein
VPTRTVAQSQIPRGHGVPTLQKHTSAQNNSFFAILAKASK